MTSFHVGRRLFDGETVRDGQASREENGCSREGDSAAIAGQPARVVVE